jgi:hypothetical protein
MDFDAVLNAANAMPLGERIQLVVAICDSIDAEENSNKNWIGELQRASLPPMMAFPGKK